MQISPNLSGPDRRKLLYYRGMLAVYFLVMSFYFIPNLILFGKLTRMSGDDFVPRIRAYYFPILSQLEDFKRTHKRLPEPDEISLSATTSDGEEIYAQIFGDMVVFEDYGMHGSTVTYRFTPGLESWTAKGRFFAGSISMGRAPFDLNVHLEAAQTAPFPEFPQSNPWTGR